MKSSRAKLIGVVVGLVLVLQVPAGRVGARVAASVRLDRSSASVGEQVRVTVSGFSAPSVMVAVCGNDARRGTTDCDLATSAMLSLDDATGSLLFTLGRPPVPCPCVVRVADTLNAEVAMTSIEIDGVPGGAIEQVDQLSGALAVTISAARADAGLIGRAVAGLGAATTYDVTVTLENRSSVTLGKVKVSASVGRGSDDDLAEVRLEQPGALEPGERWQRVTRVVVPAPSFGTLEWSAVASGAGPSVSGMSTTEQRPWLLAGALAFLVFDLSVLAIRASMRRHRRRSVPPPDTVG